VTTNLIESNDAVTRREGVALHAVAKEKLRADRGLHVPVAAEPQQRTCCCFPGMCRGGQVVEGRLPNGDRCKAWPEHESKGGSVD
jgi:hypothetical protein